MTGCFERKERKERKMKKIKREKNRKKVCGEDLGVFLLTKR
jgi:hypothetical protein